MEDSQLVDGKLSDLAEAGQVPVTNAEAGGASRGGIQPTRET